MNIRCERISKLTEYIEVIKKYELYSSYFRGENQKYPNITSSLIREYKPRNESFGLIDLYAELLNLYYSEVGYELDRMQEKNFLAFSQHHGLKTNLVDFTTAPLVALYFACERVQYNVPCGYVYILNEESTLDASEFLAEYSIKEHFCHNVFSKLAYNTEDVVIEFEKLLEKYTGLLSGKNPHILVNRMYRHIKKYPQLKKCNSYMWERRRLLWKHKFGELSQLPLKYFPDFNIIGNMAIKEFIALFLLFFVDIRANCPLGKLPSDIIFPPIPYFMYKTPLKFDRIRNQNGVFLYQAFVDYETSCDQMGGLMVQQIVPDMIIQIENQKRIMHELDMVGINKKYIYGDFDSTAQYINKKIFDL